MTSDLFYREENNGMLVNDGEMVTLGGIIADKSIKYTKHNEQMAFINLEDLAGSVECIVFPKTYVRSSADIEIDNKVFVRGRVNAGDEEDGKLIVDTITPFNAIPRKLWIKFETKDAYNASSEKLNELIKESDGKDKVVIYIVDGKLKKELPANMTVDGSGDILNALKELFGDANVILQ